MTLKIDRESLPYSPEQFAAAVDAHIAALAEYTEHLKGVHADAANEALAPEDRRVAFPPPTADSLVEKAIRYDGQENSGAFRFVADYEIVGPSLAVRKQRLMQAVSEAEGAELAKVTPPGKARYWQMREQAIHNADSTRWNGYVAGLAGATVLTDFSDYVTGTRSAEDTRFLNEQEARRRDEKAIQFWAAKAHHDIEDLTEETVDGWKMEAFGG